MSSPSPESLARWLAAVDRFATSDAHKIPRGILGVGTTRGEWLGLTVEERRVRLHAYVARDRLSAAHVETTPPAVPAPPSPRASRRQAALALASAKPPTATPNTEPPREDSGARPVCTVTTRPSGTYSARCLGGCDTWLPARATHVSTARCVSCAEEHEAAEQRKVAAARATRRRTEEQRAA